MILVWCYSSGKPSKKELANKKTKFECKILNVKNLRKIKLMMNLLN